MTTGFAFSFIERCIKESFADRHFGKAEMQQVIDELFPESPQCVYCGSREIRRWDHLYPVAAGGDAVVGNMVPACGRCDDSKQDLPYREWVISAARYSPKSQGVPDLDIRLARIDAYVAHHRYSPRPIEQRLSPTESAELTRIRERAAELRRDLDALVNAFRERTGS
jgi:hypothetical protein